MQLINIIGDSLSMVRPWEGIFLEDLYWYQLQQQLGPDYYVLNNSRRANDTNQIRQNIMDDALARHADCLIIYVGIVDCFTRLFTKRERALLSWMEGTKLRFIATKIIHFASQHRFAMTKLFRKSYVSPGRFAKNLRKILTEVENNGSAKYVFLLGIASTNSDTEARNFGIQDRIQEYNLIMVGIASQFAPTVKYLDINQALRQCIDAPVMADGHHITKESHSHLAKMLAEHIRSLDKTI